MPFAEISGGRLHYEFDGDPDAPVLMLSNSLGTDLSMWQRQVAALSPNFRVLRYDSRGQGRSLVTTGPYSIELLAAMRWHYSIDSRFRVHFCGLSLGGMIGMSLADHEPARMGKLVLANTAALLPPPAAWDAGLNRFKREESLPSSTLSWSAGLRPHFGKAGHSMSKPHGTRCSPRRQRATLPALRRSAIWICPSIGIDSVPHSRHCGPSRSSNSTGDGPHDR